MKPVSTNVLVAVSPGRAAERGQQAFELTGGSLALDFANTLDDRRSKPSREHIRHFADLVSWGRQAGAVNIAQAAALLRFTARNTASARAALRRALILREAIYRIFSAAVHGHATPQSQMVLLNAAVGNAFRHLRVTPAASAGRREGAGNAFMWDWDEDASLDRILWPVVRSAAELLASGDLARVRECAADTCGWLFVDRSKNRTRRWCDMKICGNRAKARKFYKRSQ